MDSDRIEGPLKEAGGKVKEEWGDLTDNERTEAEVIRALAAIEGGEARMGDDSAIWARALAGEDRLASAALDRLCMSFGAVAGDLALAHGSNTVVITGGLANRMADRLRRGDFAERFASKGRYRGRMEDIAVLLCTHPEPGLFGAAVAFARQHLR